MTISKETQDFWYFSAILALKIYLLLFSLVAKMIQWTPGEMKVVRLQGYHLKRPQRPFRGLTPVGTLPLPQHLNVICQQNIHSTKTYACLHRASTLISHIKEVSSLSAKAQYFYNVKNGLSIITSKSSSKNLSTLRCQLNEQGQINEQGGYFL